MNNTGKCKETTFDDYLKEQLKDPEFRKEYEKAMKDIPDKKPMVAICCGTCKHSDKKITEEPCYTCSAWCDKWEDKEAKISNDTISHPEVFNNEDNKM